LINTLARAIALSAGTGTNAIATGFTTGADRTAGTAVVVGSFCVDTGSVALVREAGVTTDKTTGTGATELTCRTLCTAGTAVASVFGGVCTSTVTDDLTRRTGTGAIGTGLSGCTFVPAGTTVVGVIAELDTTAVTFVREERRTDKTTLTSGAELTLRTDVVAGSAVSKVARSVDADATTVCLT
jgi:hypothetical protein